MLTGSARRWGSNLNSPPPTQRWAVLSLDLIGRDMTNGTVVIIENQLADSDHLHLGQLLTYAAGTSASTIVWLTTAFRDEHRQANHVNIHHPRFGCWFR